MNIKDYHRKMDLDTRTPPEPNTIKLVGMELEGAVCRELFGGSRDWELGDMQQLMTRLQDLGFNVRLQSAPTYWFCSAWFGDQSFWYVREEAQHSPAVAVARAALAAIRHWPEVLK